MLFALVDGIKSEATPKQVGVCPLCEEKVFSKCGEINIWHWAHKKGVSCDHWYEPESDWHYHWKQTFGKDNSEVVIKKDGKRHIADIYTKGGVVIELQNSPITKPIIKQREDFYGERMIWVLNGIHFAHNFEIYGSGRNEYYGLDNLLLKEGGNHGRLDRNTSLSFSWKYARRSWQGVHRYVFIDFGQEHLFWAKEGMGEVLGDGIYVSKERFITQYGGDYSYYVEKVIRTQNKK